MADDDKNLPANPDDGVIIEGEFSKIDEPKQEEPAKEEPKQQADGAGTVPPGQKQEEPQIEIIGMPTDGEADRAAEGESLFEIWARGNFQDVPEDLKKKIKDGGNALSFDQKNNRLSFELTTGEQIVIGAFTTLDESGRPQQQQYIGINKGAEMTEQAAQVTIQLAKLHGWKSIDLHGNDQQKETLWLEAQRQGLSVSNFMPDPQSEVFQKWQQEQASKPSADTESKFGSTVPEDVAGVAKTPQSAAPKAAAPETGAAQPEKPAAGQKHLPAPVQKNQSGPRC